MNKYFYYTDSPRAQDNHLLIRDAPISSSLKTTAQKKRRQYKRRITVVLTHEVAVKIR